MPPKNPMDAILERIETLEAKLMKEQEKQLTCVGDACKVLEDKISKKVAELDALKADLSKFAAANATDLDKKIDTCVGKHCELIRKDIAGVKLKALEAEKAAAQAAEEPAEEAEDPNKIGCPTCGLPIEYGEVGKKTICPHCRDVIKWE